MTIVLDELVSILTDFKTFFMRSAFAFYLLRNVLLSLNNASCPGGDFRMKVTEMLVVSLRGVNCRFWSHVRCSGQKANILTHTGIA